jgi:hypothetical protein
LSRGSDFIPAEKFIANVKPGENFEIEAAAERADIIIAGAIEAFGPIARDTMIHNVETIALRKTTGEQPTELEYCDRME